MLNKISNKQQSGTKSSRLKSLVLFFTVVTSACVPRATFSQDIGVIGMYFYDGNKKIILELEPGVVAEFGNPISASDRSIKSEIQKVDNSAQLIKSHGHTNLWKTTNKDLGVSKSLNTPGRVIYSPVFKTVKGSSLLALPGNIIVELDPSMNQKQAEAFFGSKGLRILRKLESVGGNLYEVETPGGAASLNLANSLYGQPGVISSTPNWWREVYAK